MHQVLTLEEILAQIFGSLQKHELFNCVLVCQAFKEPGLDLLWEELDGYVPWANPDSNVRAQRAAEGLRSIFNCLPSDLITAEDGNPMVSYQYLPDVDIHLTVVLHHVEADPTSS